VRAVRILRLLLAVTIAAGPTLLDRCLISCHDDSTSGAVPACHEHTSSDEVLSIHGVEACGHDHDGSPADTLTDVRGNAARHADLAASTVTVSHPEPPRSTSSVLHQRFDHQLLSAFPLLTPLRV